MISPNEVKARAQQKKNENYAFRTFLKVQADPEKLDRQFLKLHKELFRNYDCNACRNCCKQFRGTLSGEEAAQCAENLDMSPDEFKAKYLHLNKEGMYDTNHVPCDFLQEDGSCLLGDCKPDDCTDFPFTARPDRWSSLLGIMSNVAVCPVLFEMIERLKNEYGFVYHRNNRWY
ncbi:MAG: YkgJ family cysteine cluster protein [Clostridia bacterium]|nr:YkgJ family cysteine cluster protein [Clostridia bacterium]